jgi:hypothetical protein
MSTLEGISAANNTEAAFANTSQLHARIPTVSNVGAKGLTPATEILPCVGRIPKMPQLLAGTLIDPPVSVPRAKSTIPQATADADPLDDPPGTRSGALGFNGVP